MTQKVPLTAGRARTPSGLFALVDDADLDATMTMPWRLFLSPWGRVQAVTGRGTFLHRWLLEAPDEMPVVQVNGDGLDCRRNNLLLVTQSESLSRQHPRTTYAHRPTTSRFKGVSLIEGRTRPWRATISVNRKQHFLGYFIEEEDAARAYDDAARLYFGGFARTNFDVSGGFR